MDNPKVTIITPVYNVENYINECITSVLNQTYKNWEWIIIDDGSTDSTPEIISNIGDPRIKYIRQKRLGPLKIARTFNNGLSYAKGELIALLAGDDYWPEYKLEVQIKAFKKDKDIVVSYGDICMINKYGEKIIRRRPKEKRSILFNDPIGSAFKAFFELRNFIPAVTIMIRKENLERIGGFVEVKGLPAEDFPTLIRLSLEGRFYYFPQILGYYRKNPKSISFGESMTLFKKSSEHIQDFISEYKKQLELLNMPVDVQKIRRSHEKILKNMKKYYNYKVGMSYLINREYKNARKFFIEQFEEHPFSIYSAISLCGIALSYLKVIPKR